MVVQESGPYEGLDSLMALPRVEVESNLVVRVLSIQTTIIAVYNDDPSGLVANLEYCFIPIVWRDRGDNASVFAKTNKNLIYVFFYPRGKRESAR